MHFKLFGIFISHDQQFNDSERRLHVSFKEFLGEGTMAKASSVEKKNHIALISVS